MHSSSHPGSGSLTDNGGIISLRPAPKKEGACIPRRTKNQKALNDFMAESGLQFIIVA